MACVALAVSFVDRDVSFHKLPTREHIVERCVFAILLYRASPIEISMFYLSKLLPLIMKTNKYFTKYYCLPLTELILFEL